MATLDMSLDDMIKNRRNNERGGRGQGRPRHSRGPGGSSRGGRAFGAPRRGPLGVNTRASAFTIAKSFHRSKTLPWQNGLFEDSLRAAGLSGLETGTKLYISNLDTGVTNEDIRELFSEMGELMRYAIHYDKNGRPSGLAEVVFARRSDAFQALKKYNNVQLDGKPMRIVIIGANSESPLTTRMNVVAGANGKHRTVIRMSGTSRHRGGFTAANPGFVSQKGRGGSNNGRGRGRGRGRGGGRGGGRGHGRGHSHAGPRWRKKPEEKSANELDKELDNYHSEAMQT